MPSLDELFTPAPAPKTPLGFRRILSPTAGLRVSPLCLGTMSMGTKLSAMFGDCTKEQAFAVLDEFFEAGGNWIDTACGYQQGESEEWIGEWMELRGNRDQIVLATKYSSPNHGTQQRAAADANFVGNSAKNMRLTVKDAMKRLRTDYIDIFYLHFWDHTTPVEEVMRGLHKLVMDGSVLYPAVSDLPAWLVVKANDFARNGNLSPFVLYQGLFNLDVRDLERDIIPMCIDQGMAIAPWGAVGQGKFKSQAELEKRTEEVRYGGQTASEARISSALEDVANELGGGVSLQSVAIAWSICKMPHLFPIVGGKSVEHLRDNIRSLSIKLTDVQVSKLEAAGSFDVGFPYTIFGQDPKLHGGAETNLNLKGAHKILYVQAPRAPTLEA